MGMVSRVIIIIIIISIGITCSNSYSSVSPSRPYCTCSFMVKNVWFWSFNGYVQKRIDNLAG